VIKDLGDEKNRWNEPIIVTRPRNRKGINRLCTRTPKPAIKMGQLSILVVRKLIHRVRTPLLLSQKEIVALDLTLSGHFWPICCPTIAIDAKARKPDESCVNCDSI